MIRIPSINYWRAEGLKLARQPVAFISLGALTLVLAVVSVSAGLDARAWREAAAQDAVAREAATRAAAPQFQNGFGPATAVATYQLGRGDLGLTRMPVQGGLSLGVHRLGVLPTRLKASLDNRQMDSRDRSPLRNPLLSDAALPGFPAMVALLLPLVALVLSAGLLQEEREQGRLGLLSVQSKHGIGPVLVAALGWRFIVLWGVVAATTVPALALDPAANAEVATTWLAALGGFTALWVAVGGVLSLAPMSSATSTLAALGLWLALTFVAPAALAVAAQSHAPMPSRLAAIVEVRNAQQESDEHEQELARDWYAAHPHVVAQLPAVWPASFVAKALEQDRALRPMNLRFDAARAEQAQFMRKWSWVAPGLALVLLGERLAGTDAGSQIRYLHEVDAFEKRWRDVLVPRVMDRQGLGPAQLHQLPQF